MRICGLYQKALLLQTHIAVWVSGSSFLPVCALPISVPVKLNGIFFYATVEFL